MRARATIAVPYRRHQAARHPQSAPPLHRVVAAAAAPALARRLSRRRRRRRRPLPTQDEEDVVVVVPPLNLLIRRLQELTIHVIEVAVIAAETALLRKSPAVAATEIRQKFPQAKAVDPQELVIKNRKGARSGVKTSAAGPLTRGMIH